MGAYLPNASLCLILFFPDGLFSGWDAGAYLVLAAALVYAAGAAAASIKPGSSG